MVQQCILQNERKWNQKQILPPFQIIGRLTFLTSSLTPRLIQKICANLSHSWNTYIDKASHNERSNILHKFLNKTSGQIWGWKSQTTYNLERREYIFAMDQTYVISRCIANTMNLKKSKWSTFLERREYNLVSGD